MLDAEKILLINCSWPNYNLAIEKAKIYFGDRAKEGRAVDEIINQDCDGVFLSVIFSWDVPLAIDQARKALFFNKKVIIGGGATMKLSAHIYRETGIRPHYKPHAELENIESNFKAVYFTRGCNENCDFCSVWRIEGQTFTMNYKSRPAKVLMDNNLSAIPTNFKEHIVESYLSAGVTSLDCNSGFEPKYIDEYTVRLFDQLPLRWWRLGFDVITEEKQVIEAIRLIQSISKKKVRVYTMIGKEPIEQCRYRCEKVIELGCEPVPQAYIELESLTKSPKIMHDWNETKLRDMQRFFYQPALWRTMKLKDYAPRINEKPVFV